MPNNFAPVGSLLLAQSGLTDLARERQLTGVKRTRVGNVSLAAFDPFRKSTDRVQSRSIVEVPQEGNIENGTAEIVIVVETPRLVLRKLREDDLDELCSLYADEDVRRYFPTGILSRVQTKEELDWYLNEGFAKHPQLGLWATIHRSTGRFIGRCGLIPWTIDNKLEIETAYLLEKEFWRQGLGAEVAGALVHYGFMRLRLARLIALTHRMNIASIRTAERAGFSFEREVEIEGNKAQLYSISAFSQ